MRNRTRTGIAQWFLRLERANCEQPEVPAIYVSLKAAADDARAAKKSRDRSQDGRQDRSLKKERQQKHTRNEAKTPVSEPPTVLDRPLAVLWS